MRIYAEWSHIDMAASEEPTDTNRLNKMYEQPRSGCELLLIISIFCINLLLSNTFVAQWKQRKQRKRLFENAFNICATFHKVKNGQTVSPIRKTGQLWHLILMRKKPRFIGSCWKLLTAFSFQEFFARIYLTLGLGLESAAHPPTDLSHALTPKPHPGPRCSFNAQISHGVKYPQLLLPPHKIHNLQLHCRERGVDGWNLQHL